MEQSNQSRFYIVGAMHTHEAYMKDRDTISDSLRFFWGHPMHVMYTRPFLSSHKTAPGNEAMGNHAVTEWED